jgi:hypothetical protein
MDSDGVIDYKGKEYALYPRLLAEAHKQGLHSIHSQLLQAPCAENGYLAIVWAEVKTEKGSFSGIGDASPDNVGRMVATHICRMAETRAKARALRDALNINVLLEGEEAPPEPLTSRQEATATQSPAPPAQPITYQTLIDRASWIHENTHGIMMRLPEIQGEDEIASYLAYLNDEFARMTDPTQPATKQQTEKIVALGKTLGKTFHGKCVLSTYGATRLINQLVIEANQRAQEPVRS